MKLLSLFSGVGAFESALERLNIEYELVGFSEIDKYAAKSYCKIHQVDASKNLGDITRIDETKLEKDLDLITYGFPCQDISVAGKQRGFEDENGNKTRSGLFFDALRIIEATRPKVAIAENVKNLVGKKFAKEFKIVCESLEAAGYKNYWRILNASSFGIPQERERVFIVSIRNDLDTGSFSFPEGEPLELRLKDLLENEVDERYYITEKALHYLKTTTFNQSSYQNRVQGEIARTLTARDGRGPQLTIARTLEEGKWAKTLRQNQRVFDSNGTSPTLMTVAGGNTEAKVLEPNETERIRKLTPKEYWRLMGFTDSEFERARNIPTSNTQLYKQAGNSIVVPVLVKLLTKIMPIYDNEGENMKIEKVKCVVYSTDQMLDLVEFSEKEPDLFAELCRDYPAEETTYIYNYKKGASVNEDN